MYRHGQLSMRRKNETRKRAATLASQCSNVLMHIHMYVGALIGFTDIGDFNSHLYTPPDIPALECYCSQIAFLAVLKPLSPKPIWLQQLRLRIRRYSKRSLLFSPP